MLKIVRTTFLLLMGLILSSGLLTTISTFAAVENTAVSQPGLQLITASDTTLHLRLTTTASIDQGLLKTTGLNTQIQEAGMPALPYYSTYIALPPMAETAVSITASSQNTLNHVTIAPAPAAAAPASDTPLAPDYVTAVPNPAIYTTNALYPATSYTLSPPMYSRDVRVVELRLYPIRYNPVSQTITHTPEMDITITFTGAQWQAKRPLPTNTPLLINVINPEQAQQWRSLPPNLQTSANNFPTNAGHILKITITQGEGIYEISGQELINAGIPANTDPTTIAMMHRGSPVAVDYDDNGTTNTIADDTIRFYGWPFSSSKQEEQFINGARQPDGSFVLENVYWLYTGSGVTRTDIASTANLASSLGTPTTTTEYTAVYEPENYFFSTWTNRWDIFPNEPDAWYADYITNGTGTTQTITRTYAITIPHPAASGTAVLDAELISREYQSYNQHNAHITLNNGTPSATQTWFGLQNLNITDTLSLTQVISGSNNIAIVLENSYNGERIYLNDISLTYQRQLIADNNMLAFTDEVGSRAFAVSGFGSLTAADLLAWDVTNQTQPTAVSLTAPDLSGGTLTFGTNHPANSHFIVSAKTAAIPVTASMIAPYTPANLTPTGTVQWLAISHTNFITAAQDLANHRQQAQYGGYTTQVVDIADIIAQYGYGLPLPSAIQAYTTEALTWGVEYVVLFGDGTAVPRATHTPMPCPAGCRANWDDSDPTYLLTDLQFTDPYQGLIPTDHTFVTVSGNDILPDMAIGRIPAQTATEAQNVVDKIKQYEQNLFTQQSWLYNIAFVADNTDSAGNFYAENTLVATELPAHYNVTQIALPNSGPVVNGEPTAAAEDVDAAYWQLYNQVNITGTTIINYRGHGSIPQWSKDSRTSAFGSTGTGLLNVNDTNTFWLNGGKPAIILSADCLDGYFAYPGEPAISESFLKAANRGTAAHWSSSGLGTTYEHTILHRAFYQAIFDQGYTTMGQAANYAKNIYNAAGQADSEMYAFTLLGDPAMRVFTPYQFWIYLPSIIRQ